MQSMYILAVALYIVLVKYTFHSYGIDIVHYNAVVVVDKRPYNSS